MQMVPGSKLQLIRPSRLPKPGAVGLKNPVSDQKKGPVKAFAPVTMPALEGNSVHVLTIQS